MVKEDLRKGEAVMVGDDLGSNAMVTSGCRVIHELPRARNTDFQSERHRLS